MKDTNKNKILKDLRNRLSLLSLVTTITLTGCGQTKPLNTTSNFKKELSAYEQLTSLDELLGSKAIKDIEIIEQYLQISDYLNKIKIRDGIQKIKDEISIESEIINIENYKLLSPETLALKINKYIDSKDKETKRVLKKELQIQAILVNKYIKEFGYSAISLALTQEFKSKIGDAFNLIPSEIKEIRLPEYHIDTVDGEYIFNPVVVNNKEYNFKKSGDLKNLLIHLDETSEKSNSTGNSSTIQKDGYNKDRNQIMEEDLKLLRKVLKINYEKTEKGYIKKK